MDLSLWNSRERTILSVLPGSWKEKCNIFRYNCLAASCSHVAASRLGHPSLVLLPPCYTIYYGEPTLDIRQDKALFRCTAQHNNSGPWHQLCMVQRRKLLLNFPALEVGGLMVSVNAFAVALLPVLLSDPRLSPQGLILPFLAWCWCILAADRSWFLYLLPQVRHVSFVGGFSVRKALRPTPHSTGRCSAPGVIFSPASVLLTSAFKRDRRWSQNVFIEPRGGASIC